MPRSSKRQRTSITLNVPGLARSIILLLMQGALSRAWRQGPLAFNFGRARIQRLYLKSVPYRSFATVSRRPLSTRTRLAAKSSSWQIGDSVLVDLHKDQSQLIPGVIEEIRKAGWYSIRLEDSQEIQKVRTSQLLVTNIIDESAGDQTVLELSSLPQDQLPVEEPVQAMPAATINVDIPPNYSVEAPPPPPPKMDNLDALLRETTNLNNINATRKEYLQQLQHHASIRQWVVFTDLHCAPSTLDTCLQVLKTVHRLAQERNAGVLFLGDFWHHRGTLRVDCLNAVLRELREWTVPLILIPGNHDQVTLGGHSHGLTPLEHAYRVVIDDNHSVPGPLVFSHPTLFAGALFVPHVRDIATLESILKSDLARNQAEALFVHADVTGAYMNDLIVSTGGVHPLAFPPHKPIYSGHFHKPHTVTRQDVAIEYLGSPFETSLAEAQQSKALSVLDAQSWKCVERIPLDIGRKHYKPHSVEDLMALGLDGATNNKMVVRKGDRIVLTLPRQELLDLQDHVEDHIRQLRKNGVAVEVREDNTAENTDTAATPAAAAPDWEDLTPTSTWEHFWEEQVQRGGLELDAASELRQAGLALLEEIEDDASSDSSSSVLMASSVATHLEFDSVSVEGYGPFPNRVEYPLNDRGLVLLRGTNLDGGSDSNGSGKTSLAMAALWALTGSADPRPVQDNKVSDVVNDSNKNACVTVTGHINGKPFSIMRTKTPKKSGLAFLLDGHDMATQSVKETMVVIEEKLGVSAPILARTMFHGQHSLNELLEATDAKLKEELSLIVPLELWQAAATLSRSKGREASKKENELEGMASLRMDDMEKFNERCLKAAAELSSREQMLQTKEAEREAYKAQQLADNGDTLMEESSIDALRESIAGATADVETVQAQIRSFAEERDSELQVISKRLSEKIMSAKEANEHHQKIQLGHQSSMHAIGTLNSKVDSLGSLWQVDLDSGQLPVDFIVPDICPTCLQPVSQSNNGASSAHDHGDLQTKAEEEIKETLEALVSAQKSLASSGDKLESARLLHEDCDAAVLQVQEELKGKTKYWDDRVSRSEEELEQYQSQIAELTNSFALHAELQQQARLAESRLESEVATAREAVRFAKETHSGLKAERDSMAVDIGQLRTQIKEHKIKARQMSSLSDAFGYRGVQTFVLRNAVKDLQSLTQNYLDDFSDGAQRLKLSLDAGDNKISRQALVREPDGSFRERPLATLSGGQWRRCSLALTLGFADLVATRGGLRPSLIVLDEPLTHLDRAGRGDVGKVLRKILGHGKEDASHGYSNFSVSTIIIILQDLAAEELEEAFDRIDEVVKQNGASALKVDEISNEVAQQSSTKIQ